MATIGLVGAAAIAHAAMSAVAQARAKKNNGKIGKEE